MLIYMVNRSRLIIKKVYIYNNSNGVYQRFIVVKFIEIVIYIVNVKINNAIITKSNPMENINKFIKVIKNYFKQNSN